MFDKHHRFESMNRRRILTGIGAVGAASTVGVGLSAAQSANDPSREAIEAAVDVPCVDHWTTIDAGDICYVAAGICLLIPTPAGAIAAKGCVVSGATCFALETIERLGCGDGKVHIYDITCPVPGAPQFVAVPDCFNSIAEVLENVLDEYLPYTPGSSQYEGDPGTSDGDAASGSLSAGTGSSNWAFSEEFLEEYDPNGELGDVETF